ncbi:MAG: phosphatase PAP2 family protein [Deltaproteobacteria bacterium]|nr:phosphatase PAP2 family protein [Deltaproteobacteria bacterium]MBW2311442.1 phosphatase PAP2 family protein [Deltaproteobacteria bacterium]
MKRKVAYDFLIPLFILGCLTMVFWLTDVDIALQEAFYSPDKGWYMRDSNPWKFLYDYGNIPGLFLAAASLIVLALSFAYRKALRYRKIALFLAVLLALGPGLITYSIFKDHWGRPRPGQLEIFGGEDTFLPVWVKGNPGQGKSFPSGHASIGFYLFAPFFFLRRSAKRWAVFFLALGIGYGMVMGIGRMVQGGHFASDVVWAGGLTYLTGLLLFYIFRFDRGIWWA